MRELIDYIMKYGVRGACMCGRCVESIEVDKTTGEITNVKLTDPAEAAKRQPTGHTADVQFFKVSVKEGASAEELKRLIEANQKGEFTDLNVFDGLPHHFIELGGWIGDQGLALMLIGLGGVLGLWDVMAKADMVALIPGAPRPKPKKWMFHIGIHRGTITSRDGEPPKEAESLEQCQEWAREALLQYASLGCQIWYCYAISPTGERTTLIPGAPYS